MKYSLGFVFGWCAILILILQQWLLIAWCITVVYSLRYPTHGLLIMGLLLDGYFGAFYSIPVFSILALMWFLIMESLRDQLNVKSHSDVY